MKYHITIFDGDGNVLSNAQSDSVAAVYGADDGFHAESYLSCNGLDALELVMTLDNLRDHILDQNPLLKSVYNRRADLVDGTIKIDVSAIERAMHERDDPN